VQAIKGGGIYFRVGRTTKSTLQMYQGQDFVETQFDTAPYTHVLLDLETEVCAVAKKAQLATSCTTIANKIGSLMEQVIVDHNIAIRSAPGPADPGQEMNFDIKVEPIRDPEHFVSFLKNAKAVTSFWYSLNRPNAFEAHEDFVKPFSKIIQESSGHEGKIVINGDGLNAATLEEIANSAAGTGAKAGAKMTFDDGQAVTKHLEGNPLTISCEDLEADDEKRDALTRVRALFQRIIVGIRG